MTHTVDDAPITDPQVPVAPLGPDSLAWRLGLPRSIMLIAARALLLQVSHPTVGAGVRDHSNYKNDPWGRFESTVTSLQVFTLGGPRAAAEAQRLRDYHKQIKGTGFHGERYSAMSPEAYAWVHLSNFDTLMEFQKRFVGPLPAAQWEQLYAETKQVGRLLGLRDRDMPDDIPAFRAYVDDVIRTRLQDNATVREFLDSVELNDVPPPSRLMPKPLWNALKPLGRTLLRDCLVGTLPPRMREKLDLPWTPEDQRRLDRLCTVVRRVSAATPPRVLHYPIAYRARRAAIAYTKHGAA
jgi:uncharacterized protein (DUF2236 family)